LRSIHRIRKHNKIDKMKKIYYLKSCSTNQRILKEIDPGEDVELQNIKEENIDEATLDFLKEKVGSYEALFSKKAMKYRSMGLNNMDLTEDDFKRYMLEEYTFLKRPFMINGDDVFIGNAKKTVEAAVASFNS
jgi:arsenate reductase